MIIVIIIGRMTKMMDAKSMLLGDQWSARGSGGKKGLQGTRGHIGDHLGGYKQTYSGSFVICISINRTYGIVLGSLYVQSM